MLCVVFVYMCLLLDEAFLMTVGLDTNLVTGDSQFRLLLVFLILSVLIDIRWNLRLILIFISLMAKDMNISLSVSWTFEILLLRILFRSVPHFYIGLFGLLISSFLSSLCILENSPLLDVAW